MKTFTAASPVPEAPVPSSPSPGPRRAGAVARTFRLLWGDKFAFIGASFLLLLVIAAIFAPVVAPFAPDAVDILNRSEPPAWAGGSWTHVMGTDSLGRDMLSRLIYGARLSLLIGVSVVLISAVAGTLVGILAGYKGGRWDTVIMRTADAQLAFPGLLLVLLVIAFVGPSIPAIVGVLALYGWMIYARLVRSIVLQLKTSPAIQSAQLLGCSTRRILFRHILPNLGSALLTQAMLELARVVLVEASLSYLGLGVQPPNASWGLMVAENQSELSGAWWTVVLPGLALALTTLAVNLVANWMRTQTDPTQRARRGVRARRSRRERTAAASGEAAPTARAEDPDALFEVDQLDVTFHTEAGPVAAVSGASFAIRPGETLGIVGESGSGKSSLGMSLLDLVAPPGRARSASMRWQGKSLTPRKLRKLRGAEISMIFQDPMTSLNPLVPVGRQVTEMLVKHLGMSEADARTRAEELFTLVGIPSPRRRLDQLPHQLSGGLRQRVMIAIALAPEPKLLVADEPTTALDTTIQAQILDLVADLQKRLGIAVLIITHDLGVVARVCDRVLVMYGGRIVEEAQVMDLFERPRHRYTEALLRAMPRSDQAVTERGDLPTIPGRPPTRMEHLVGCPFRPRCAHATESCQVMPESVQYEDQSRFACWHPVGSE